MKRFFMMSIIFVVFSFFLSIKFEEFQFKSIGLLNSLLHKDNTVSEDNFFSQNNSQTKLDNKNFIGFIYTGGKNPGEIHIVSIDGKQSRTLVHSINNGSTARISPDGNFLAYSKFIDIGKYQLSIINISGNEPLEKLIPIDGCELGVSKPTWRENNDEIAISCNDNKIFILEKIETHPQIKKILKIDNDDISIDETSWSPDGRYISFYYFVLSDAQNPFRHGPIIINLEKCEGKSICEVEKQEIPFNGISCWTPENLLAIVDEKQLNKTQITFYDPSAKKNKNTFTLSNLNIQINSIVWSIENDWLAYSAATKEAPIGSYAIYIQNINENSIPVLLNNELGGDVLFWMNKSK